MRWWYTDCLTSDSLLLIRTSIHAAMNKVGVVAVEPAIFTQTNAAVTELQLNVL